jgi:ribonucleoside-diphosphate reductase alpha chain
MPREWGRDPFYTFLMGERNEGLGDVYAFALKSKYSSAYKKLSAQLCDNLGIPEKMSTINMQVVKRDGSREDVSFDKVLLRIKKQAEGLEVNPTLIAQRTLARIYDGVQTAELDELAAQLSISLVTTHPDYGTLASRIAITNHHRNTLPSFY